MCHFDQSTRSCSSVNNSGEVVDAVEQLDASRRFMEEIDQVTARLLDNVIYDVISNGIFDSNADQPVIEANQNTSNVETPEYEANRGVNSEVRTDGCSTTGTFTSQASEFVNNLLNQTSEPVDTTEYQATAQHFLAEVLDTIESQATDGKFAAPSSKNGGTIEEINHFEVVASRSMGFREIDIVRSCDISGIDLEQKENVGDMKRKTTDDNVSVSKAGSSNDCQITQTDSETSSQRKVTSGGVMFYVDAGDQKPALKKTRRLGKMRQPKLRTNLKSTKPVGTTVAESEDFEDLIDGLIGQIIHEALTLYNPLFQFYKASGSLNEVTIDENPLEVSQSCSIVNSFEEKVLEASNSAAKLANGDQVTLKSADSGFISDVGAKAVVLKTMEVLKCSAPEMILERKVFDVKRWICISRPQYKFSCGMSSVVSCFNFLYSTLGHGHLEPVSQEAALEILDFPKPYCEIKFGPFTGNSTLKRWFQRLCAHFKVRGYFYTLYKPKGATRTSISEKDALNLLKEGLQSCNTAFIYHCYNHYMCPIGFEVTPEYPELAYTDAKTLTPYGGQYPANTWILIGDTSRKHQTIHSRLWEDIVLDLNCESPYHYDIRKPHLGIFKGPRPMVEPDSLAMRNAAALYEDPDEVSSPARLLKRGKKSGNMHCLMAITKLRSKLAKESAKSMGIELSDLSLSTVQSSMDVPTDDVVSSCLSNRSEKNSDISEFVDIICSDLD